jgi:2-oxoisovalerate dehydrogenase E1 component
MTTPAELDRHFREVVGGMPGGPARPGDARPDPAAPVRPGSRMDGETLLAIYDVQAQSRHLDFAARWMQQQGRGFYTIGSAGHEGNAAVAAALRPTDPALLHYRSGGFYCARARQVDGIDPVSDVLLGVAASADEPIAGGRHKVFGRRELAIIPQTSTIASHLPRAVGLALGIGRAVKLGVPCPWPRDSVVVASVGDASVNHSTAVGAINAACYTAFQGIPVPLLIVCEDNGIGISVPTSRGWVKAAYGDRARLRYLAADGCDVVATYDAAVEAVTVARARRRPVFLHLSVVRFLGHAGSDAEAAYRPATELIADLARDPLVATAGELVRAGLLTPGEAVARYVAIGGLVHGAAEQALASRPLTGRAEVMAPLAGPRPDLVAQWARGGPAAAWSYFKRAPAVVTEPATRYDPPAADREPVTRFDLPPVSGPEPVTRYDLPPIGGAEPVTRFDLPPVSGAEPVTRYDLPPVGGAEPVTRYDLPPVGGPEPVTRFDLPPVGGAEPVTRFDLPPVAAGGAATRYDGPAAGSRSAAGYEQSAAAGAEPVTAHDLPAVPSFVSAVIAGPGQDAGSARALADHQDNHADAPRPQVTLAQAVNRALADLLEAYPGMLVFGEDVGRKGGVYGVTKGLQRRFGPARVFDTLLDEQSILGLALGGGLAGLLPVPEIQYLAYLHNAEDQIRGEAATQRFFSAGQFRNPMVLRVAGYAYQKGFGGHFHNDNAVGVLRDIPGLVIASPARPDDAAAMLRTCLAAAAVDGSVCVFIEPIALYHTRDLHEEHDGGWLAPYPDGDWHVPVGSARGYGDGGDLTLVTFGNGLRMSLRVARRLEARGIGTRVLDLRWLAPLPVDDILREARATGRVLVVDETRRSGGVSEGVVTALVDSGLGIQIARVTSADSFVPLGQAADAILLDEPAIERAAVDLVQAGIQY